MIRRWIVKAGTGRWVTVEHQELMTKKQLNDLADDLASEGLYSDASWYRARARQTDKTYWDTFMSSSVTSVAFATDIPKKVQKQMWNCPVCRGYEPGEKVFIACVY